MSKENIVRFFKAVEANPVLQEKVSEIRQTEIKNVAREIANLASAHGLPFSSEEFVAVQNKSSSELSEKDLDKITGGDLGYGGHLLRNWG